MNRGSRSCEGPNLAVLPAFNEAPIHESGKFRHGLNLDRLRYAFNEAPIHESGKYTSFTWIAPGVFAPSMRPRFMNRGSMAPALALVPELAPSMRPRFMNRGSE